MSEPTAEANGNDLIAACDLLAAGYEHPVRRVYPFVVDYLVRSLRMPQRRW